MEISREHIRHALLLFFNQKITTAEGHRILMDTYDDGAPSIATCENWFRQFKSDLNIINEEPKKIENADLQALLENPAQSTSELARALDDHFEYTILKVKISKKHIRHALLLFFNQKKSATESYKILVETYGDGAPIIKTCEKWFRQFESGNFNVNNKKPKKIENTNLQASLDENTVQSTSNLAKAFLDVRYTTLKVEISKEHIRHALFLFFNQKITATESHRILTDIYGDGVTSLTTCEKWFRQFESGDFNVNDEEPKEIENADPQALLDENSGQSFLDVADLVALFDKNNPVQFTSKLADMQAILLDEGPAQSTSELAGALDVHYEYTTLKTKISKEHIGHAMLLFFNQKIWTEGHRILTDTYGDRVTSFTACEQWVKQFKSGDFNIKVKESKNKIRLKKLQALLDENPTLSTEELAKALDVHNNTVLKYLHKMGRICRKEEKWTSIKNCTNGYS